MPANNSPEQRPKYQFLSSLGCGHFMLQPVQQMAAMSYKEMFQVCCRYDLILM